MKSGERKGMGERPGEVEGGEGTERIGEGRKEGGAGGNIRIMAVRKFLISLTTVVVKCAMCLSYLCLFFTCLRSRNQA